MGKYAERARELFFEGYNCCQSVVGAFAEQLNIDFTTAIKLVEGLGGGMGRMRLTCGAVSGMAVLAGAAKSSGLPKDLTKRGEIYALVREMAEEFRKKNGSIICAELLGSAMPKDNSPYPQERTPEYYKKRPCPQCIYDAGLIIEKHIFGLTD